MKTNILIRALLAIAVVTPPIDFALCETVASQAKKTTEGQTSRIEPTEAEKAKGAYTSSIRGCEGFLFVESSDVKKYSSFWCTNQPNCSSRPFIEVPTGSLLGSTKFQLTDGTPLVGPATEILEKVGTASLNKVETEIKRLEAARIELEKQSKLSLATGKTPLLQVGLTSEDVAKHRRLVSALSQGDPVGKRASFLLPETYRALSIRELKELKADFDELAKAARAAKTEARSETNPRRANPLRETARNFRFLKRDRTGAIVMPPELTSTEPNETKVASPETLRWIENYIAEQVGDPKVSIAYSSYLEERTKELEALHAKNPLITQLSSATPTAKELAAAIGSYVSTVLRPAAKDYRTALEKRVRPGRGSTGNRPTPELASLLKFTEHDAFLEQYIASVPIEQRRNACQLLTAMSQERSRRENNESLAALGTMGAIGAMTPILGVPLVTLGLAGYGISMTVEEGNKAREVVRDARAGAAFLETGADKNRALQFEPVMAALDLVGTGSAAKSVALGAATAGALAFRKVAFGTMTRAPAGSELRAASDRLKAAIDRIPDAAKGSDATRGTGSEAVGAARSREREQAIESARKALAEANAIVEAQVLPANASPDYLKALEESAKKGHLGTEDNPDLTLAIALRDVVEREAKSPAEAAKDMETVSEVISSVDPASLGSPARAAAVKSTLPRMVAVLHRAGIQVDKARAKAMMVSKEVSATAWKGLDHLYRNLSEVTRGPRDSLETWFQKGFVRAGGDPNKADKVIQCALLGSAVALEDSSHPNRSIASLSNNGYRPSRPTPIAKTCQL